MNTPRKDPLVRAVEAGGTPFVCDDAGSCDAIALAHRALESNRPHPPGQP